MAHSWMCSTAAAGKVGLPVRRPAGGGGRPAADDRWDLPRSGRRGRRPQRQWRSVHEAAQSTGLGGDSPEALTRPSANWRTSSGTAADSTPRCWRRRSQPPRAWPASSAPTTPTRSSAATTSPTPTGRRPHRRRHQDARGDPRATGVEARPGPPRHAYQPQQPRQGLPRRRPHRRGHHDPRGDPQAQAKLGPDHPDTLISRTASPSLTPPPDASRGRAATA